MGEVKSGTGMSALVSDDGTEVAGDTSLQMSLTGGANWSLHRYPQQELQLNATQLRKNVGFGCCIGKMGEVKSGTGMSALVSDDGTEVAGDTSLQMSLTGGANWSLHRYPQQELQLNATQL
nr:hypothetical transcript [Hymenolepis microstoma]